MNYFINTEGDLIFYISCFINLFILFGLILVLAIIAKRYNLSKKILIVLVIITVPPLLFFSFTNIILDPYHQGVVRELFIFDDDDKTLLSVWLTRIHTKRFGANFEQRLQTFDLESGQSLGTIEMVKKHYSNDYQFYWDKESNAWGYQPKTTKQSEQVHHINLVKPELIETSDNLPQSKPTIKEGWPLRIGYFEILNWKFQSISQNIGKNLIGPGGKITDESSILLEPNFIEELNTKEEIKNKIWISHKSAILGDYEQIVSYIDSNGQEINKINLSELFEMGKIEFNCENKNICDGIIQTVATYTYDNEIFIFITRGENFMSSDSGFTLTAIRTDKETGKILGQIDYIE